MASPAPAINDNQPEGYEMLARFLAGSENAVFHCFKSLYTENLLYQQAEIVHLSGELGTLRNKDRSSTDDLEKMFHRNWAALRSSSTTGESGNSHGSQGGNMQLQKIKELQTALDRYYDSLIRFQKILAMGQPHRRTMRNIFSWMSGPAPEFGNVRIISHDRDIFRNQNPEPLVSLLPEPDSLTAWVRYHLIQLYHDVLGWRILAPSSIPNLPGVPIYQDKRIDQFMRLVTVTLACGLPVASIFVLHFIVNQTVRLAIVLAMSVAFALCMALMTTAKTHEIFGATSTFAAVLVVFVSTDGPISSE